MARRKQLTKTVAQLPPAPPRRGSLLCQRCGQRSGTHKFGEGAIAMIHGCYEMWCERCVLEKQIGHAEERASALPGLRERLAQLQESA